MKRQIDRQSKNKKIVHSLVTDLSQSLNAPWLFSIYFKHNSLCIKYVYGAKISNHGDRSKVRPLGYAVGVPLENQLRTFKRFQPLYPLTCLSLTTAPPPPVSSCCCRRFFISVSFRTCWLSSLLRCSSSCSWCSLCWRRDLTLVTSSCNSNPASELLYIETQSLFILCKLECKRIQVLTISKCDTQTGTLMKPQQHY